MTRTEEQEWEQLRIDIFDILYSELFVDNGDGWIDGQSEALDRIMRCLQGRTTLSSNNYVGHKYDKD